MAVEHMQSSIWHIVLTAVSLGIVHVLSGPDHLGALVALSNGKSWRQAFLLGAQWGCGHSIGIVAVVILCIFITGQIWAPNRAFSTLLKYVTGISLVLLGIWTFYRATKEYKETPESREMTPLPKSHSNQIPCHDASYILLQSVDDSMGKTQFTASAASIGAGIVHGIAGPGSLLAVIPTLAMHQDTFRALLYLVCFCASSIVAMGSFAALYGELTQRGGRSQSPSAAYYIGVISSALSICVGIVWIIW
ncbi:uncharacterized protein PHALS_10441 [Plasmopara halstedii]|uniref:Nickel/cobalt efflux system n=1 Tax=Plasmopara halstedii TaxID=4781 RepID=A0A0P1AH51_PLAHL|nr:uncharacterized protein PHALS_10441 [Plasmopara halstedii]CEG40229.1 hypothetical protein PHALS_10441 [Plasmopara halstedii]|eukprot:XP_024576598.1 hypothetical protein PHALS_10441 [Plasmopara halstedii]